MDTVELDFDVPLRIYATNRIERELRAFPARKEPEQVAWLKSLPEGALLFDVGSNTGAYVLYALALGLKVVAFEPSPANFRRLCENLRLNKFAAPVVRVALSDEEGLVALTGEEESGQTHSVETTSGDTTVTASRMDSFLALGQPDAIKIDVDGGEVRVLRGARKTLEYVQTVLVETVPDTADDVAELLIDAGFRDVVRHPHLSGVCNEVWRR